MNGGKHVLRATGLVLAGSTAMAVAAATSFALVSSTARADEASVVGDLLKDLPKNWGRWGEDDELGALNYLDGEQILRGAQAVEQGKVFTLQVPMLHGSGPVFPGRIPARHYMTQDEAAYQSGKLSPLDGGMKYSDDATFMYLQGTTHVDALAHAWYGDQVYGGKSAATTIDGHAHADVAALAERGIVGRGVLLDVGRHKGGDNTRLAPNECITLQDLQETASEQGVEIQNRDILVIRTGSIPRFYEDNPDEPWDALTEPGLCYSSELVTWFDDMEIPAVAADNLGVEKVVQEIDGKTVIIPLHGALMRDLGVVVSEVYWLEALAEDSAEDGQYTFMFAGAPLKADKGTGAPINPLAIK